MAFKSKFLIKKAYSGYYSANEVARNAQVNPAILNAEWYDLMPVRQVPPKKPIIKINDEWGYVPVDFQAVTAAADPDVEEWFTYFGMVFDVRKAAQIIAAHPHEAHPAPKQWLEGFVGTTANDEAEEIADAEGKIHINMLQVGINKEHLNKVNITEPGIAAEVTFKANPKRGQSESKNYILIDGNHRAKKALREGKEFKVYVLTPEESWQVMHNTPAFLMKNLVKPAGLKKEPKAKSPKAAPPVQASMKTAEPKKQEYTSERTSVNQLPAVFNRVEWKPKSVNLDYGGGRFDNAVDFLKGKGVKNLVFDPYNRAAEHNREIMHMLKKRKADTATIANVLNVIKEPEIRKQVMRKVRGLVKPGGTVYIMCYRGEGKCPGPTCNGWQENRPIKTYLEEVQQVFGEAELNGSMIVARV